MGFARSLKQKLSKKTKKFSLESSGLRDTRGVKLRESLIFFNEHLLQILQALECISALNDLNSSSKADRFIRRLTSADFFVLLLKIINSISAILFFKYYTPQNSLYVNTTVELINNTGKMI